MIDEVTFDERGLAPCVIQDASTGEVLTLAWVNAEALERTIATGEMHLWSRSRDELWHKGETSGNVQRVRELRYDCDADAVLALVDPTGPACHTGERTCFFRASGGVPQPVAHEALPTLERTIGARGSERPEGSYTVRLLDDRELTAAKVREEADEVARAVAAESDERVVEEAADLLYHLEVALRSRDVGIASAYDVLNRRRAGRD
ncbi:MAG TPA: bifunctional phosphoribosyl-AMP cyclohydrolase/phosphoribosyl-ATP diphosphatase HisIE [Solirubrobacterales bacterium]|nr:bifunctional phosphoribosyl-AMP cyclohydrolase/phosphoribosyl-ATP diphosphatase HisIE [Solirubrobacterales bacterium]